jgi:ABC-2 type transport system permease protein
LEPYLAAKIAAPLD